MLLKGFLLQLKLRYLFLLQRQTHARVQSRASYHTHDVGQDSPRGADESTHDGQQVVVEQEALCTQSPARVAVEHRDDNRHVSASNGRRQSHTLG